ncbi:hypothetical protein MTO96_016431 [Rhipicephalus appendiculatus]
MGHQAVMYGLVCAFLGVPEDQAVMSFLFSSLRTTVAAAVRLGAGQRMQFMLQSRIPEIIERHKHRTSDSAANVFPVVDVMQSSHDQLFARMFYS